MNLNVFLLLNIFLTNFNFFGTFEGPRIANFNAFRTFACICIIGLVVRCSSLSLWTMFFHGFCPYSYSLLPGSCSFEMLLLLAPLFSAFVFTAGNELFAELERRTAAQNQVPTAGEGVPTKVRIQMYIEGMSSFRSHTMDFHLDIYFQEQWTDPRLAHNGTGRLLIKDPTLLAEFWHPDLYFANARTSSFHEVTSPNFLVWIYPNGTVWYDIRVSLTVICTLNLERYPFDSQSCTLRILSYAYDVEQLVIEWGGPVEKNPEILFPDMRMRKVVPGLRNDTYATGVWSCATAEFVLDRELVHHLIQSFIPSSLIVIVSWFNFWLDVECVPGRVSLSITTLLTLATQNSAERMTLPESGYVKASDIFSGACMAFVFAAMIEFTVVNYFTRRKQSWEKMTMGQDEAGVSGTIRHFLDENGMLRRNGILTQFVCFEGDSAASPSGSTPTQQQHHLLENGRAAEGKGNKKDLPKAAQRKKSVTKKKMEQRMKRIQLNRKAAQSIDQRCRIYFPLAFLLFNLFYWSYYMLIASDPF